MSIHTEISRDFRRSNTAAQSFVFARDTSKQTKTDKTPNVDDKYGTWRMRGGKPLAERRFDGKGGASTNNQTTTTTTRGLTPKARAGAVQSPRKREGGTEGRRKSSWTSAKAWGPCPRAHPSMVCVEEGEGSTSRFWSASLTHRSQTATMENNELTSRLVTSQQNMAARGATPQTREFILIDISVLFDLFS